MRALTFMRAGGLGATGLGLLTAAVVFGVLTTQYAVSLAISAYHAGLWFSLVWLLLRRFLGMALLIGAVCGGSLLMLVLTFPGDMQ